MVIAKRKLPKLVYLRGVIPCGYTVETSYFDGTLPIDVPSVLVGNSIVRALREVAANRLDLFPPSKLAEAMQAE